MSFVQHLKGRALNSCQSCLRSRLKGKGLKENHVGTKGLLNYFEYFETSPRRKQDLYEQLGTTKAKVEMLERELQLGTLAAEGSIPDIMNEKLQVYRLLRSDEEPAKGLYSKAVHCKDDAAWRMPVSEHIETGSNVTSRFISTSRDWMCACSSRARPYTKEELRAKSYGLQKLIWISHEVMFWI